MEPRAESDIACIKIWSREPKAESRVNVLRWLMHVLRYGVNVLRYVMHVLRYGIGCFRHCATIFGTVRFFEKIKKKFWLAPLARIIITPAYNYYGCGYFITRADTVWT